MFIFNVILYNTSTKGMMSVIKTLQLLKKEKVIVDREREACQYNALEYLISKACVELPIDALFATVGRLGDSYSMSGFVAMH